MTKHSVIQAEPTMHGAEAPTLDAAIAAADAAWSALGKVTAATQGEGADYEAANGAHSAAVQAVRELLPRTWAEYARKAAFLNTHAGNSEGEADHNLAQLAEDAEALAKERDGAVAAVAAVAVADAHRALYATGDDADASAGAAAARIVKEAEERLVVTRAANLEEVIFKLRCALTASEPDFTDESFPGPADLLAVYGPWAASDKADPETRFVASAILDLARLAGDADPALLSLAPEFERRWELERAVCDGDPTDKELDPACDYTGEIAKQISAIPPTSIEGCRVWARMIMWAHGEQEDFREEFVPSKGTAIGAIGALVTALADGPAPAGGPDAQLVANAQTFIDRTHQRRADPAWDRRDPHCKAEEDARKAVLRTPAKTLAGVIAKARMAALHSPEEVHLPDLDLDEELRFDIMNDLLALAGEPRLGTGRHEEPPAEAVAPTPTAPISPCPVQQMVAPWLHVVAAEDEVLFAGSKAAKHLMEARDEMEARLARLDATTVSGAMIQLAFSVLAYHRAHDLSDVEIDDDAMNALDAMFRQGQDAQLRAMRTLGALTGESASDLAPILMQPYDELLVTQDAEARLTDAGRRGPGDGDADLEAALVSVGALKPRVEIGMAAE